MNTASDPDHSPVITLHHAALVGAALFIVLCLLFWATATAQTLPPTTPDWMRSFTPTAGLVRLTQGLFWSAAFGAALFMLLAAAWNFAQRRGRGGFR
jgi:hypothetical protein